MDKASNVPFEELGVELQAWRQKLHESVDDVSGAVEIDTSLLEQYEIGSVRPSEDVLMLLISHFGIQDDEAVVLWQLAGYDNPLGDKVDVDSQSISDDLQARSLMIMMTLDTRILYSDNAQISANKQGVTLNFLQNSTAAGNPQIPVARIGMSYDQAHEFMHVLNQTISQAALLRQPKGLQPRANNNKDSKKD